MNSSVLLLPVILPLIIAVLMLAISKRKILISEILLLLAVTIDLAASISFLGKDMRFEAPWSGFGFNLSLRLYQFSSFILLSASAIGLLVVIYSIAYMKNRDHSKMFFVNMLLALAFVNGAILSNNIILMLFFWEGLLIPIFGMIMSGGRKAFPAAVKALVLSGTADLLMTVGICITVYLSNGQYTIEKIHVPMNSMGCIAFIFLMIGSTAKAGSMPFHTWIPDAAEDGPLPFMAFMPGALEKLLGIYFLTRISLNMFEIKSGTSMSFVMMALGSITILFAAMMALIQHDYKRLLAYHSISQVGYMILGIGTAVPAGIVGGIYHMINNAIYKSCLFMTAGSVEKQTGTTDLKKLGGLRKNMPVTFACFLIAAASISGVPLFNGFFSKELIFEGALENGFIFYAAALSGAFFTALSFLKLGHAVYFGKQLSGIKNVKDAPLAMTFPMLILSSLCILFGVYNKLPLKYLIEPVLGGKLQNTFSGFPQNSALTGISLAVLILACLDHMYGFKKTKSGLGSVDHIHYAPGLITIYGWAEMRYFDIYDMGMKAVNNFAKLVFRIDHGISWIYDVLLVKSVEFLSGCIKKAHSGDQSRYLKWSIAGMLLIIIIVEVSM